MSDQDASEMVSSAGISGISNREKEGRAEHVVRITYPIWLRNALGFSQEEMQDLAGKKGKGHLGYLPQSAATMTQSR